MKHLYSLMLALVFLTCSNLISAQQFVTTTNASGPSSCDGTALNTAFNSFGPPMHTWSWYQDSTQIAGLDSMITNLCPGNYSLVLDSMGVTVHTEYFTIGDPCFGFSGTYSITNCTPNNCDGNIVFTPVGGSAPYTFIWSNGTTTMSPGNLCPGSYMLSCADSYGCSETYSFSIGEETLSYFYPNLTTVEDYGTVCTGQAYVNPTGGAAPYSVSWSTGDTTTLIDSLCAGIYSVTVWDSNMDSTSVSFLIVDSTTYYGNNPYPNDPIVDSLYLDLVTNCEINYTDIDSASLYQAVYDSVNQNLYVTWVVYTPTDTTYINDTLGFAGGAGVYSLTISVYCPNKSINDFFKIQSTFSFNGTSVENLAVNENLLESIHIYPNPFTNSLSVDNQDGAIRNLKLIDLNGRLITEKSALNSGIIQLTELEFVHSGTYILILSGESTAQAFKVTRF